MDKGSIQATFELIMERIESLREQNAFCVVAIEGRSGSGKRSLASSIHEKTRWPVVHMEDFALRPDETADEEGGGPPVAYDRFEHDVLRPLRQREIACFRTYNRKTAQENTRVMLGSAPMVIVEGVYSLHPRLQPFYDLKIVLDVGSEDQLKRLRHRETPEAMDQFRRVWLPQEEQYMREYDIRSAADLYFMTKFAAQAPEFIRGV